MGKVVYVMLLSLGIFSSIGFFEDAFAGPDPIRMIDFTGTIRDFQSTHPDFEPSNGMNFVTPGMVESTLGVDGKPVFAAVRPLNNDQMTTEANFNQWFNPVGGVNLESPCTLTLTETGPATGIFRLVDLTFFPIDNPSTTVSCAEGFTGFGNSASPPAGNSLHNYHFTYQLHTTFVYDGGETFEFTGDDDIWVFIDGQLVMDLGGTHTAVTDQVILDNLGLTLEQRYDFDFFFAERQSTGSQFQMTASVGLNSVIAEDDAFSTDENVVLNTGNVFDANPTTPDSDPNGDTFTLTEVNGASADVGNQITLPSGALLTQNSDGTFTYNPNGVFNSLNTGETASDSYTYTIEDDILAPDTATDTATVTITIDGIGTPQTATIEIIKEAAGANVDFGFTSTGGLTPPTFTLNDAGVDRMTFDVPIGTYSVSENDPTPQGYSLTDVTCLLDAGAGTTAIWDNALTADIVIASVNDFVSCTFTNEPIIVNPCEDLFIEDSIPIPNFILSLLVPEHLRAYGGGSPPSEDPCANLSITKSDDIDPILTRETLTYTVTVFNGGPDPAQDVVVTDFLPAGVTFQLATSDQGTCSQSLGIVTCDLGTVASTGSVVITIEVFTRVSGTITNTASVSSSTLDDDPSNNSVTEDTLVIACTPGEDEGCRSPNQGGTSYPDPNLGDPTNRLGAGHDNGFCMGQICMNVRGFFNHFPAITVPQGSTQSFTLLVDCQRGASLCNHFEVAGALPDSNFYEYQWAATVDRQPGTDNWDLTVTNPFGEIGEVTAVVQQIDQTYITATFNVEFLIPGSIGTHDGIGDIQENNRHLHVTVWDSGGGMRNYIFNEGMYVDDIYAYPQVEYLYDNSLVYEELCLNENPNKRYTCAFDKVRDWTIKNAEDKLKEIYDKNNYDTDSEVN